MLEEIHSLSCINLMLQGADADVAFFILITTELDRLWKISIWSRPSLRAQCYLRPTHDRWSLQTRLSCNRLKQPVGWSHRHIISHYMPMGGAHWLSHFYFMAKNLLPSLVDISDSHQAWCNEIWSNPWCHCAVRHHPNFHTQPHPASSFYSFVQIG